MEEERRFDSEEHVARRPAPRATAAASMRSRAPCRCKGVRLEQIAALSAERRRRSWRRSSSSPARRARSRATSCRRSSSGCASCSEVGLGYLQLNRSAKTLSGGEAQRIRLAAQLGSNLRGVLYVLDEPTIGLHPRDNEALLNTLIALRDKGNSLLVVEHDEETMRRADTIIDLGPGAGRFGGEVVGAGHDPGDPARTRTSVTGQVPARCDEASAARRAPRPAQGECDKRLAANSKGATREQPAQASMSASRSAA